MSFDLTNEQKDIKRAARQFAESEFLDVGREFDRKEEFPREIWKKACQLGFIGVFIQENYGGPGLGVLENCLIMEEFSRVDPGIASIVMTSYGSELVQLAGTEDQKRKYLPPITRGEQIVGMASTETRGGIEISYIRSEGRKQKDEYVINGEKTFVVNGAIADSLVVICLTDPHNFDPLSRHSAFIAESRCDGVQAQSYRNKLGVKAADIARVSFKNVHVPHENLIGKEGDGHALFRDFLLRARVYISAMGTGISEGALDQAIRYAKMRHAFGHPIGFFQAIHLKLAEMATRIEAVRNLYYKAAWEIDQGKADPRLIAMAKWLAGEVSAQVTAEVIQVHGGYGFMKDLDPERFYRDAQFIRIFEGTTEIDKTIIAKSLLGDGILGNRKMSF